MSGAIPFRFPTNDRTRTVICAPSASCSLPDQIIKFDYMVEIVVDPIQIGQTNLIDVANEYIGRTYENFPTVVKRQRIDPKFNELVDAVKIDVSSFAQIRSGNFSQSLKLWARNCEQANLNWIFERFSSYLRLGTIELLEDIDLYETDLSS